MLSLPCDMIRNYCYIKVNFVRKRVWERFILNGHILRVNTRGKTFCHKRNWVAVGNNKKKTSSELYYIHFKSKIITWYIDFLILYENISFRSSHYKMLFFDGSFFWLVSINIVFKFVFRHWVDSSPFKN